MNKLTACQKAIDDVRGNKHKMISDEIKKTNEMEQKVKTKKTKLTLGLK